MEKRISSDKSETRTFYTGEGRASGKGMLKPLNNVYNKGAQPIPRQNLIDHEDYRKLGEHLKFYN